MKVGSKHHVPGSSSLERKLVPTVQEIGWASGFVWMRVENLTHIGIWIYMLGQCLKTSKNHFFPISTNLSFTKILRLLHVTLYNLRNLWTNQSTFVIEPIGSKWSKSHHHIYHCKSMTALKPTTYQCCQTETLQNSTLWCNSISIAEACLVYNIVKLRIC